MRFPLAVAVVVVGISVSGLAQQNGTLKVKPAAPEKAPKQSAPVVKMTGPATASGANAKDLRTIEHETAKVSAAPRSGGKPGKAIALKPVKDKPNPPINFNGTSGKTSETSRQPNALKGRLKQKGHQ